MKQYNDAGMVELCDKILLNRDSYGGSISSLAESARLIADSVESDLIESRGKLRDGRFSHFDVDIISMYSDDPNDVRTLYEQIWENDNPDELSQYLFFAVVTMRKRFDKYTIGHLNQIVLDMWDKPNGIYLNKPQVADILAQNCIFLTRDTVNRTFEQYTNKYRGDAVYALLRLSQMDAYATSRILEHYRQLCFRDKLHFIKSTIGLQKINYLWSLELVELLDTADITEADKVTVLKAAMKLDGYMPEVENAIKVLAFDKEFMKTHSNLIFDVCYTLKMFDVMNMLSGRFDDMDLVQQANFMSRIEIMLAYKNRRLDQ